MRWDRWQVAIKGGSNEPPGAARWSELARGMPSVGSTVAGVSGAVDGEDEGEQQRERHLQVRAARSTLCYNT